MSSQKVMELWEHLLSFFFSLYIYTNDVEEKISHKSNHSQKDSDRNEFIKPNKSPNNRTYTMNAISARRNKSTAQFIFANEPFALRTQIQASVIQSIFDYLSENNRQTSGF